MEGSDPSIDLIIGLGVHKGMEVLLSGGGCKAAAEAGREEFELLAGPPKMDGRWNSMIREGQVLVPTFIRGWERAHPDFFDTFEVLCVEKEVRVPLSGDVTLMARADAVLRDRSGALWVLNHKTCTSWDSSDWMYDVQMWTEALAMEHHFGEPVLGCIITGFVKGGRYAGLLSTPLIYCWEKLKEGEREIRDVYTSGWGKFLLTQEEAEEKLRRTPDLQKFFPISPPVTRNDAVVEAWVDQVVRREGENFHILRDGSEEDRLMHFWQRFSKWNCPRCPFSDVCFGRSRVEDMLMAGRLRIRVDHHKVEGEHGG